MKISVCKSEAKGAVKAPSSKSYAIRGLMCAALAKGESGIINPLSSDDTDAALNVLRQVGVRIQQKENLWQITGGNFHQPDTDLFCGDSAATLRFMTALCSLIPGRCRLLTGLSLAMRPVKPLVEALNQLGMSVSCQGEVAPIIVNGGKLKGGVVELPGNISSQFVSALLLAAPLAEDDVIIKLAAPVESKPYILMTLDCMERFGIGVTYSPDLTEFKVTPQLYQPTEYLVEGDWSSASYLLALGAISGEVAVEKLNSQSLQGDKVILNFLKDMGAWVDINGDLITVRKSNLKAIQADLSDCIDLLPTMAILAAVADGVSQFDGISRARLKESNRVSSLREGLERMSIEVIEESNRLTVTGSQPKGAVIDSKGDHRIAMAFGILGSVTGEIVIEQAECVTKTFPDFWGILQSIGVRCN